MLRWLEMVLVVDKQLGDVYRVKIEFRIAEFATHAYLLTFFDQRVELITAEGA